MNKLFYPANNAATRIVALTLLCASCLISRAQSNAAEEGFKMSLNEAIEYAVQNQPSFQNYKVAQQIASAKNLQAVSEYIPTLGGTMQLQNNLKLPVIALKFPNPLTGMDENLKIQQGTAYQGAGSIGLSVPVVNPAAIGDIKYNKQQQKLSDLQLQQALIDLKMNVSRAYYQVLVNEDRIDKLQENMERDKKTYDDTKVKYDNQNALKSDLNRAYLNLQNTKYSLKVSQDSIKTSMSNLAQLIGLPLNSSLELTDSLPTDIKPETLPEYPDFKAAEQTRIELKTEYMQEYLNKLQLHKTNYGYVPALSGFGSLGGIGLDNSNLFQKNVWNWNNFIGLTLTVPIFDGLQKMTIAQQQKLAIRENENNIQNIRQTINYQLTTTSVNYINSFNNLALIKENVKLAEEVVDETNSRYQNAMATYQEVLDAENTLKDTQFTYLQALYTFLIADLDWKKANGKL